MNPMHEANRRGWDAASAGWQATVERDVDWRRCPADPAVALVEEELELLGDVAGKDVCVLGSGDNLAVFALAGMGARLTSVDISQAQLDTAGSRAGEIGLDISFLRADVVDLQELGDESFDLVYTGGHVAVWVSDLKRYYAEAGRILRRGAMLMVNEYHPFRRIWRASQASPGRLELACGYFEPGPHRRDRSDAVPGAPPGSLPSYEFNWTVADYVTALMQGGCELAAIREIGDRRERWESAPLAGLPTQRAGHRTIRSSTNDLDPPDQRSPAGGSSRWFQPARPQVHRQAERGDESIMAHGVEDAPRRRLSGLESGSSPS